MTTTVQRLTDTWSLAADPDDRGRTEKWYAAARQDARPAPVPGIIQQVFPRSHGIFWYYCRFVPAAAPAAHERALLSFGAVDYRAEVWLNGSPLGGHEGGETPFDLDATDALLPDSENLIAVRVLNPTNEGIDGVKLDETPHRNKRSHADFGPGSGFNTGGIILPVTMEVVPPVRITSACARASCATGQVVVTLTVSNDTAEPHAIALRSAAAPAAEGTTLVAVEADAIAAPGQSTHELTLTIDAPRLWDLADPYLYRISTEMTARIGDVPVRHDHTVRIGFRELTVVDGFFRLNGRRILLRSTHTGNHCPIGQVVEHQTDVLRRDLLMAKTAGYNTVRFISGMPYPEQLDLCDEIGLMVYEESYAAWLLGNSPDMKERYDLSVREMILRDRNHPSVTIWGMLNETPRDDVFRHAVESLELVRSLDPTRLVLLSSGRWDGDPTIGSVSNPGSETWEHVWGDESPDAGATPAPDIRGMGGWDVPAYVRGAGDVHAYPVLPPVSGHTRLLRELGSDTRPVFLSEYGVGSQFNAIDELRDFDRFDVLEDLFDRSYIRGMAERLKADFTRLGMERAFAFPEDFLRDSYRHMVRQRRLVFDLVRSNPRLCGYNLTGMLDHALTGEGIWSFWRMWKPGIADVMQDGWAPLRWSLFVDPMHARAGRPLTVEAVLANEDAMRPGTYPVTFRVFGPHAGTVWEQRAEVDIRPNGPLAIAVMKETIEGGLDAGEYTFAASLERGGTPRSDRLTFRVSDVPAAVAISHPVHLFECNDRVARHLADWGVQTKPFDASGADDAVVILVGAPAYGTVPAEAWKTLAARAERGATVAFLSTTPFLPTAEGPEPAVALPLGDEIRARHVHDWLYHKEIAAKPHRLFDGLPTGLLDWDCYGQVTTHDVFDCHRTPDETVAASFSLGYPCKDGYDSGIVTACFARGAGRVIVNAMRIVENLGDHPVADRLLANLVAFAAGHEE